MDFLKRISAYRILLIPFLFSITTVQAQPLFTNNGAVIYANPMSLIAVNGSLHNIDTAITNNGQLYIGGNFINDGRVQGDGVYEVTGNWINNADFLCGVSNVNLIGDTQLITGTRQTTFYTLNLSGTGIKRMTLNATTTNRLNLTDRELATNANTMFVTNTYLLAVANTTGFVSSLGNGSLSRRTASSNEYFYPVGSSLGIMRYRPVNIHPNASDTNTYTVGFVNHNPTLDGYDVNIKDSNICIVDSLFYHHINRTTGVDSANITIYYVPADDGNWNGIVNWRPTIAGQWRSLGAGDVLPPPPMVGVTEYNWGNFSNDPYALAAVSPDSLPIIGDTLICIKWHIPVNYVGGGHMGSVYDWDVMGGDVIGDTTSNTITVHWTTAGVDTLRVWEIPPGGCRSPVSSLLVLGILPVANFIYVPDTNIFTHDLISFRNASADAITWTWNFGDGLELAGQPNPYHVYENVGIYDVTLYITSIIPGCDDTTSKTIDIVEGVISPNVFTPNGDGYNDYFNLRGSGLDNYYLKIFNRWGEVMFESFSPSNKWDGKTLSGTAASDGTYFYVLTAKSSSKDYKRTGMITLIR